MLAWRASSSGSLGRPRVRIFSDLVRLDLAVVSSPSLMQSTLRTSCVGVSARPPARPKTPLAWEWEDSGLLPRLALSRDATDPRRLWDRDSPVLLPALAPARSFRLCERENVWSSLSLRRVRRGRRTDDIASGSPSHGSSDTLLMQLREASDRLELDGERLALRLLLESDVT